MKYLLFLAIAAFTQAESLRYNINWQSGISLGEATIASSQLTEQIGQVSTTRWSFDLDLDASVPGFVIRDHDHSTADADLCSTRLQKTSTRGKRKSDETLSFDQKAGRVSRKDVNGGTSETSISSCGRDALAFLQFVRKELAQGRVVPQQTVMFGAGYQVRLENMGEQIVKVGEKQIDADRVTASIKGQSSDLTVEIFFARDAARTPVMAKLPLALGVFTVELTR